MSLDVQLVGTTTQMAVVTLRPGQVVYAEAGKFLFSSGDVVMETKLTAPGEKGGEGGLGGLLRGAVGAGKRVLAGESFAFQHFTTPGGDGLLGLAGVLPGEMRHLELDGSTTWFAEKDAFVAAEAGVRFDVAFSGLGQGLMGGEGFILERFTGRGSLLIAGAGDFIDLNPADYGGTVRVDTGCIVAWDDGVEYSVETVGRLNRQGIMSAVFGGEGLTLATLRGNGRVILQSVTIEGFAKALAKNAVKPDQQGLGAVGGLFSGSRG
ncbi:AIM24 family protein [Kineococcus arenarius]|uniref:AIM24 family protein n=1 Tax=unclassified Kineococcus TaxID=2621656 RepID=UPI003D7F0364